MRTRRHGRARVLTVAVVLALLLTACGGEEEPDAGASPEETAGVDDEGSEGPTEDADATEAAAECDSPEPVTFSTNFFILNGGFAPFYAGIEEGIWEKHCIDLTIELGRGAERVASEIGGGATDFGMVEPLSLIRAVQEGTPITFVAMYYQNFGGGVATVESRHVVSDFDDVEGLKVGTSAGNAYIAVLDAFTDVEYEVVTLEPAAFLPSLLSGQIDAMTAAAWTGPARAANAAEQGLDLNFFIFGEHGVNVPGIGIATRQELVDSDPELVQRFVTAFAESVVWSSENPEQAVDAMLMHNPEDTDREVHIETLEELSGRFFTGPEAPEWFVNPESKLQTAIEMSEEHFDVSGVAIEEIFTNEFANSLPEEWRVRD